MIQAARFIASLFIASALGVVALYAQSSKPIVVQAATEMTPPPRSVAAAPDSTSTAIKLLEEIKAANAETLKKQEATLSQLDELQKAADQLRIFAKRG